MYVYKELVGKATVVRTRQSNTLRPILKIHHQRVTTLYTEAARYDFNSLLNITNYQFAGAWHQTFDINFLCL